MIRSSNRLALLNDETSSLSLMVALLFHAPSLMHIWYCYQYSIPLQKQQQGSRVRGVADFSPNRKGFCRAVTVSPGSPLAPRPTTREKGDERLPLALYGSGVRLSGVGGEQVGKKGKISLIVRFYNRHGQQRLHPFDGSLLTNGIL